MRSCCCPRGGAGIASAVSRRNMPFGPALLPSSSTLRPHGGFLPLLRCQSGSSDVAAADPIPALGSASPSAAPVTDSAAVATPPALPTPPPVRPFLVSTGIESGETSILSPVSISIPIGDRQVIIETGLVGRQANGAVTISDGETILYTTACASIDPSEPSDFVPLTILYQERLSAAGRTSGGFIKREGRTRENEVLVCRLVDRPIRPLMMKGFNYETQVLVWVLSYDCVHTPEPLAITAAGAALAISDIPFQRPVAGVRVGFIDGVYVVNPTVQQLISSKLDMVIAGTSEAVLMIEGYCDFLTEEQLLKAVEVGQKAVSEICKRLEDFAAEVGRKKNMSAISLPPVEIEGYIEDLFGDQLASALQIQSKRARGAALCLVEKNVLVALTEEGVRKNQVALKDEERDENWDQDEDEEEEAIVEDGEVDEGDVHVKPVVRKPVTELFDPADVKRVFKDVSSKIMRKLIVQQGIRSDGRGLSDVRPIQSLCGLLPRAHGSALFTRGETQAMAVVTLGGTSMGQRLDNLSNIEDVKRFYLQYTFPPSCVGETGRIGAPSRREIGHGSLAERALEPALPPETEFPYTIRVESTITESNGSSSMASVCGGCLAMLDAGIPLKSPIAGVAMGLVLNTQDCGGDGLPVILTDILGSEDALGDMDFKVAGNDHGITAFQMDIKVEGITLAILEKALAEAKKGRCAVLAEMTKSSPQPARSLSKHAPLMAMVKVPTDKLNLVIGPGGKTVKGLIEETGVDSIDIDDDGTISILSRSHSALELARARIAGITMVPVVGQIYRNSRVKSVVAFGCFIEIAPGREALLHISELDNKRVEKVEDVANPGDVLDVKLIEINARGQLRVSRRALLAPVHTAGVAVSQIEKTGEGQAVERGKRSEQTGTQRESSNAYFPNRTARPLGGTREAVRQGKQSDSGAQAEETGNGRDLEPESGAEEVPEKVRRRSIPRESSMSYMTNRTASTLGGTRDAVRQVKQSDSGAQAEEAGNGRDLEPESGAEEVPEKVRRRSVRQSTGDVPKRVNKRVTKRVADSGLDASIEKASSNVKKLANSTKEG